jgi:hypothetical protein
MGQDRKPDKESALCQRDYVPKADVSALGLDRWEQKESFRTASSGEYESSTENRLGSQSRWHFKKHLGALVVSTFIATTKRLSSTN